MTKAQVTQEDKKYWCKKAYEKGYVAFEHMSVSDYDTEKITPDVRCSVNESQEYQRIIWDLEDSFNFERDKHDWDNFGIYGIVEDVSVSFESGAYDTLKNKEYNVENISHMWEY